MTDNLRIPQIDTKDVTLPMTLEFNNSYITLEPIQIFGQTHLRATLHSGRDIYITHRLLNQIDPRQLERFLIFEVINSLHDEIHRLEEEARARK